MMAVAEGLRLGRYEVAEPLGSGGMGEVYRARDTVLGRDVALKLLPREFALDPSRRIRFEREARILARISHPNIVAIHDFGTEGDTAYSVTELLKGETLRERIERGALPWEETTRVATAVADGLSAAHEHGVTHRDLKPENIFLTDDDRVKILDFGVARISTSEFSTDDGSRKRVPTLTRPGTTVGTVGYMSPEQLAGREVDGRGDLFSLGCVIYEMLSGVHPFVRGNEPETMLAILREEPAETGLVLPREVDRLLRRLLEKDPERRYRTAEDLAVALRSLPASIDGVRPGLRDRLDSSWRRWRGLVTAASVAIVLLAAVATLVREVPRWLATAPSNGPFVLDTFTVTPFDNRTGDPSLDSLGALAADRIAAGLEATGRFRPADDGAGAGLIVAGTYFLADGRLEFQVNLVEASSSERIGTVEPVQGGRDSAPEAMDRLQERVVTTALWHLDPAAKLESPSRPPAPEAYREYQAGLELFFVNFLKSREHFERAAEIDPDFMAPRFWCVDALWNLGSNVVEFRTAAFDRVREKIGLLEQEAGRLSAVGRQVLAWQRSRMEGNRDQGLRALRRAAALAPSDVRIGFLVAHEACRANRPREALALLAELDVEPLFGFELGRRVFAERAKAHHLLGEFERELEVAREGFARYPGSNNLLLPAVRALAALGRVDALDAVLEDSQSLPTGSVGPGQLMLNAVPELRAHGYPEAADALARRMWLWIETRPEPAPAVGEKTFRGFALGHIGRFAEAQAVWKEILDEHPDYIWALGRMGAAAARAGDLATAREADDRLATWNVPWPFGEHTYYRARIAALLGERDAAVQLLRQAIAQGFGWFDTHHRQRDFESLWDYEPFRELLRPKG